MTDLAALVAHARFVPAADRAALASRLRELRASGALNGAVLLETCHRAELIGPRPAVEAAARSVRAGEVLDAPAAAEHLVRLAAGLESAVVGEDQVLHQLRTAAREARTTGPLDPALDHLLDLALRAGRRARTWLPPRRPTLADAALDRAVALAVDGRGPRPLDRSSRPVLVVGAGSMGRLVAVAARGRGLDPLVASRTAARAAAVAAVAGGRPVALDPGPPILAQLSIGVVALSGPWTLGPESRAAILASGAPIIDLSSPPSVPAEVAVALGPRLVTIDDLAALPAIDPGLRSRLEDLVAWTLGEFDAWAARDDDRTLAAALADRAEDARTAELAALWQRMPDLDPGVRAEIERMAADLTGRLLRDPLERLGEDADGGRARLARELFRL